MMDHPDGAWEDPLWVKGLDKGLPEVAQQQKSPNAIEPWASVHAAQ